MKSNTLTLSKYALFLAVGALGFTSCGDDDDSGSGTPASNKTRTQLLTENSWRLTGLTETVGSQTTDLYGGIPACDADDLAKFNAANNTVTNGTYELNEGAAPCTPGDAQVYETGTWAFMGTNQVVLTSNNDPVTYNIIDLSDNTLKVTETEVDAGTTTTWTYTYTAQ